MNANDRIFLTAHVFAYVRGELEEADRRRFEGMLLSSETASDHVSRVSDMMRAMKSTDTSVWSDTDADTHFLRIEEEIQGVRSSDEPLTQELPFQTSAVASSGRTQTAPEDAMFGAILTRIGVEDAGETLTLLHGDTQPRAERPETVEEVVASEPAKVEAPAASQQDVEWDDDYAGVAGNGRGWVYALAAIVVAAIAGLLLMRLLPGNADDAPVREGESREYASLTDVAPVADAPGEVMAVEPTPEAPQQSVAEALALASEQPVQEGGVSVFANDASEWTVSAGPEHVLDLRAGAVLVEFLPEQEGETLRVRTQDYDIQVVGTVFFASVGLQGPEVGVITGAVDVTVDGAAQTVSTGHVFDYESGVVQPQETASWTGDRIDVSAHEAALAQREEERLISLARATAPATERVRPTQQRREVVPEVVAEPAPIREEAEEAEVVDAGQVETLRDVTTRARAHASAGEWALAASEYERALEMVPRGAATGAMIRLDLSRIYLRELERPVQAAGHLRSFVREYPSDVAVESARDELCRISDERGWAEPLCAGRD